MQKYTEDRHWQLLKEIKRKCPNVMIPDKVHGIRDNKIPEKSLYVIAIDYFNNTLATQNFEEPKQLSRVTLYVEQFIFPSEVMEVNQNKGMIILVREIEDIMTGRMVDPTKPITYDNGLLLYFVEWVYEYDAV
jgi:hypothetical protein